MPAISYQVADRTTRGYLAVPPAGAAPGPWHGVVVIHEAFGLNDDIRNKADQFAAHGYLALAPDLYHGKSWVRCVVGAARQLRARSGSAFDTLEAARRYLAGRDDCTGRTGVIGFCLGGGFALLCAPRYGGRDPMGTKHPERLQRALTVLEIAHDVQVYPGVGHRFLTEPSGAMAVLSKFARMNYVESDAADAWRRIYAFFGEHLGS